MTLATPAGSSQPCRDPFKNLVKWASKLPARSAKGGNTPPRACLLGKDAPTGLPLGVHVGALSGPAGVHTQGLGEASSRRWGPQPRHGTVWPHPREAQAACGERPQGPQKVQGLGGPWTRVSGIGLRFAAFTKPSAASAASCRASFSECEK